MVLPHYSKLKFLFTLEYREKEKNIQLKYRGSVAKKCMYRKSCTETNSKLKKILIL